MDSYIDVKTKNLAAFPQKFICFTVTEKKIPKESSLADELIKRVKKEIETCPGSVIFFDTRKLEIVSFELIWYKICEMKQALEDSRKKIFAVVFFVNNKNMKNLVNSITTVHPCPVPLKVCVTNEEGLTFVKKVNIKRKEKSESS